MPKRMKPGRSGLCVAGVLPAVIAFAFGLGGTGVPPVHADIDPLSGIDFVTVGAVGNAPWAGDGYPADYAIGRGRVDYEYKIGRYEVNTAQWCDFLNAVWDRPASDPGVPWRSVPAFWGAVPMTPTNADNPNARRWRVVSGQEMRAVGGMSWRMSAIFCNWLESGKSMDRSAFLSGVYDVSTFGGEIYNGIPRFTDITTRAPGSHYFIPSWDEWLKAAHYDQNKVNSDGSTGGWWRYSNGTDARYVYGPPGVLVNGQPTTSNAQWVGPPQYPGLDPFVVPLGAYNVTSPWGLYDVAGATSEWTEYVIENSIGERGIIAEGEYWSSGTPPPILPGLDSIYSMTGSGATDDPSLQFGLRMGMAVPSPGSASVVVVLSLILGRRHRRNLCVPRSALSPP